MTLQTNTDMRMKNMSDIRIAAQFTPQGVYENPEGIAGTLKRVKEIGYDAVQVSGMGHIDRERQS